MASSVFLSIGDIITLEANEPGTCLAADSMGTVTFMLADHDSKTPRQFERCLWRVYERLSYADKELSKSIRRSTSMTQMEKQSIADQAIKEGERNEEDMKKSIGNSLLYGQTVQLQHVATGYFLAAKSSVAKHDKHCLALYLDDGSSACHFRISPRYKVRTDGGQVLVKDEILLASLTSPGFYVHGSQLDDMITAKGGFRFDEANLSRELSQSGLTVNLYSRTSREDEAAYISADEGIRFFAPDNEAFLSASCDPGLDDSAEHHIYMGNRIVDIPSRSHPSAFSASSVWALELLDRTQGGLIEWAKPYYRIKHVPTRKYLTVSKQGKCWQGDGDKPTHTYTYTHAGAVFDSAGMPVTLPAKDDETDVRIEFELTLEVDSNTDDIDARQTFSLNFVEAPRSTFIPKEEVLAVIAHRLPDKTELYVNLEKEDAEDALLPRINEYTGQDTTGDAAQGGKRPIFLSSVLHNYDAMIIVGVERHDRESVDFLSNSLAVLEGYAAFVRENASPGGKLASRNAKIDFDAEIYILSRLICGSVAGDHNRYLEKMFRGQGSKELPKDEDPIMTLEGATAPVFQNCAREQYILESLIRGSVAPQLAGIILEYTDKNETKRPDFSDPRFKRLVRVHRLIWRAIMMLVKDNDASEERVVNVKSLARRIDATTRKVLLKNYLDKQKTLEEQEDLRLLEEEVERERLAHESEAAEVDTAVFSTSNPMLNAPVPTQNIRPPITPVASKRSSIPGGNILSLKKESTLRRMSASYKEEDVIFTCFFWKEGSFVKNWKRRYVVLTRIGVLSYLDEKDTAAARGTFFCQGEVKCSLFQKFGLGELIAETKLRRQGLEMESSKSGKLRVAFESDEDFENFIITLATINKTTNLTNLCMENNLPCTDRVFAAQDADPKGLIWLGVSSPRADESVAANPPVESPTSPELALATPNLGVVPSPGKSAMASALASSLPSVPGAGTMVSALSSSLPSVSGAGAMASALSSSLPSATGSPSGSQAPTLVGMFGAADTSIPSIPSAATLLGTAISTSAEDALGGKAGGSVFGLVKDMAKQARTAVQSGVDRTVTMAKALRRNSYKSPDEIMASARSTEYGDLFETNGMAIMIQQLQFPVGAAETLTSIIHSNRSLLESVVDQERVDSIIELIKFEGPSDEFLDFFAAICSCDSEAIRSNQDIVADSLLYNRSVYDRLIVDVRAFSDMELASLKIPQRDVFTIPDIDGVSPQKVYGSDMAGKRALHVYAAWKGDKNWELGSDSLFYTPESFGLPYIVVDGKQWVHMEDLCEPLDRKKHEEMNQEMEYSSDDERAQFESRNNIALYFEAQIELFCELLYQRNYRVIYFLEKIFSYEMLLSLIFNMNLPYSTRGRFVKLLSRLWIQRFPHSENCGKQSLPELIWILPEVEEVTIDHPLALPHFEVSPESALTKSPDPFFHITSASKFQILTVFIERFFCEISRQSGDDIFLNLAIREVVGLMATLTSYGFFPTKKDVLRVVKAVFHLLDGRRDIMSENEALPEEHKYFPTSSGPIAAIRPGLDPAFEKYPVVPVAEVERYKLSDHTSSIMDTKRSILQSLLSVYKLRDQFFLSRFLFIFKDYTREQEELEGSKSLFRKWTDQHLASAITSIMDDKNDATNGLNLSLITHLEGITIDLLMYEDEALFEEAFRFLTRQNEDIESLLNNAKEVQLLEKNELPCYRTFENLERQVAELRQLFESAEDWGVARKGVPLNHSNFNHARAMLATTREFLSAELKVENSEDEIPKIERQETLYLVDMHRTLFLPVHWNLKAAAAQDPSEHSGHGDTLIDLAMEAIDVLIELTDNHDDIPKALAKEGPGLVRQLQDMPPEIIPRLLKLLVVIYKGDEKYLMKTPKPIFTNFAAVMCQKRVYARTALQFFYGQLVEYDPHASDYDKLVKEDNIPRNQVLVFRAIQAAMSTSNSKPYKMDYTTAKTQAKVEEYIALMDVLSLCARHNTQCGGASMHKIAPWETTAKVIRQVLNSAATGSSDLGIGVTGLTPHLIMNLRAELLRTHLNLFQYVDLNPKAFDEQVVLSRTVSVLCVSVSQALFDETEKLMQLLKKRADYVALLKSEGSKKESVLDSFFSSHKTSADSSGIEMGAGASTSSKKKHKKTRGRAASLILGENVTINSEETKHAVYDRLEEFRVREKMMLCEMNFLLAYMNIEHGQHGDVADKVMRVCSRIIKTPEVHHEGLHTHGAGGSHTLSREERLSGEILTFELAIRAKARQILEEHFSEELKEIDGETGFAAAAAVETFRPGDSPKEKAADKLETASLTSHEKAALKMRKEIAEGADLTGRLKLFVEYVKTLDLVEAKMKEEEGGIIVTLQEAVKYTDPNDPAYVAEVLQYERTKAAHGSRGPALRRASSRMPPVQSARLSLAAGKFQALSTAEEIEEEMRQVRTNRIKFGDLIKRMIRHIDSKMKSGAEHTVSVDLIDIMCRYLEDGSKQDHTMKEHAAAGVTLKDVHMEGRKRQRELNKYGVTDLVYRMLSMPLTGPNANPILVIKALELGCHLFNNGEADCQERFLAFGKTHDPDGRCFANLRHLLSMANTWVEETRFNPAEPDEDQDALSEGEREQMKEIYFALKFMQQLCEGHNLDSQNCLRDQSSLNKRNSYNLVEAAVELLHGFAPRRDVFRRITENHCQILMKLLSCIVEMLQGPCSENQALMVRLNVFSTCRVILGMSKLKTVAMDQLISIQSQTAALLAACLEGRRSHDIAEAMISKMEPGVFEFAHHSILKYLVEIEKNGDDTSSESSFSSAEESSNAFSVDSMHEDDLKDAINNLLTVQYAISAVNPDYRPKENPKFLGEGKDAAKLERANAKVMNGICCVEVAWNQRIEELFFSLPEDSKYLSDETKERFRDECEFESCDTRVKRCASFTLLLFDSI